MGVVLACALVVAAAAAVVLAAALMRTRREATALRSAAAAADARARRAEEGRAAAFDRLPLAALRVDAANRLVEANLRARERFPHLVPGMSVLESFGEHRLADAVGTALADGAAEPFEVRLFADERRTYRVAIAVHGTAGGPEAHVFMADLTEAVAYQELRSQFVANVSHELRTPLTGLRGLIEALGDPEMDPGTHARFVARATAETLRLEALITDILFLSELESTQGLPADGRSELTSAIAATVETLAPEAAEARVRVEVRAPGPVWTPLTDHMARTVVRNLLENAIRYAGPDARVEVALAEPPGADPPGGWVELRVTDDGAGIPERHLPHVFERFYRADPSRSKRLGGTGLGLSIVKHIAERFGGAASAESREGFGTTVRVRLPAVPPGPGDAAPAGAGTHLPGAGEGR